MNRVPTVTFLAALPRMRVCGMIHAGMLRYAAARKWDVRFLSWKEARAGALRDAAVNANASPLGFVIECGDGPCNLPASLFGGLPAVFVNCVATPSGRRFVRLPIDNAAIARVAFDELALLNPTAFAVVDFRLAEGNWPTLRMDAFSAAAAKAGAECHAFLFRHPMEKDASGETRRLADWLSRLPRRTAVFAVNDQTSADVVEAARLARLRIPQDIALLGVDNDPAICEALKPTLSSIQIDFENAGFLAAKLLGKMIAWSGTSGTTETTRTSHAARSSQMSHSSQLSQVAVGPLLAVRRESTRGFGRREPNILEAVEHIRREACDGLTAAQLINRFPGSRWLFELRFREATGHSVLDEILHVRLERACTLLAATDTSIDAIADFCGFDSPRSLRAHFLKHIGLSMREFRARNRG